MTSRMIGDREPPYEFPARIASIDGLRAERRRLRRSMSIADTRGDTRAFRQLTARLSRLDAVARWRGWSTTGSRSDDDD